ncbi:hypothetical protein C3B59_17405 [Cryobacterium zongtaii]|uniref:Uncharacterized protein n=1 Tax=Cryobacterium zongtaii TaxID=1259217 RepID=A0A2S3Z635_9MICO|nr:hypothetical protein [Cryobacterium zongtaii]POH59669.1 hypothetical protein C3B59_17405 [Cryobacterium zongtaii]
MLNRLLDWIAAKSGTHRVSSGMIIDAVKGAATSPREKLDDISTIGMAAGEAMFSAAMVFPKLVARNAKRLAELGTALASARAAHRAALVAASRYLERPDLTALAAARSALDATRYSLGTALRAVHVTGTLYWVVMVMLFAFDSWVFFTMYLDLFDADPGQAALYWITVAVSAAGALVTPMLVLWAADQTGARLARLNVEFRSWLDREASTPLRGRAFLSMFGKSIFLCSIVTGLMLLFVGIAAFRFGEHAASLGSVQVPVWLTGAIMGMVPFIATAFAYSRRDPNREHRGAVDAAWAEHETRLATNASQIAVTLLAWEEAWRALAILVSQIVAEANLSIQHVEQLVVHALDVAGIGGPAPFRVEVIEGGAVAVRAGYQATLDGAATGGEHVVKAPAQMSSTTLPVPPWVQNALESTMQILALNLPGAQRRTDQEVAAILLRAFGPRAETDIDNELESDVVPAGQTEPALVKDNL